jgi:ABC-type hemin transport system ATPase subunit
MMKEGRIVATGSPNDVITEESVHECFEMPCEIHALPKTNKRIIHFIN